MKPLLIRGGTVVNADREFHADVLCAGGKIVAVGAGLSAPAGADLLDAGGRYLMWYGGYDLSVTNPGPYRVGLAESLDGLTWEKRGVAVELAEAGADAWSTRDPAVAADERGYIMLYVGMAPDRVYRLLRAEADVCP